MTDSEREREGTLAAASSCPMPLDPAATIQLAHGGGGRLMHRLIDEVFVAAFGQLGLDHQHDGATVDLATDRIAISTDSFVVRPIEFPGGDIGMLAVNGTVNDLAMCGARPLAITVAVIIEEGFAVDTLRRLVASMADAARTAGVRIATGDTKVIDRRGSAGSSVSEIFITTTGVGEQPVGIVPGPEHIRPGDVLLVNGDIGRHGLAVLTAREGLQFETTITTDCAPVHREVAALLEAEAGITVHALRDCTRGGLATSLHELATTSGTAFTIREADVPVRPDVHAGCELLGLDPLFVANEGRFVTVVPAADADAALTCLQTFSADAAVIGQVADKGPSGSLPLVMELPFGTTRLIDLPAGEQLPRIC